MIQDRNRNLPTLRTAAIVGLMLAGAIVVATALEDAHGSFRKLVLAGGLAALCWISVNDVRTLRAPNRVVYPVAVLLTVAPFIVDSETGLSAAGGALLAFSAMLVAVIAGRGAMGYGDAKVAYISGALVGVAGVIPMLLLTFVAGFGVATVALLLRLRGRKDVIAFTPFLFLGVALFVLVADHSLYLPAGA